MKRIPQMKADRRTLAEKLVGLIMAASETDLREAQAALDRIGRNAPNCRAARTVLPTKVEAAA